MERAPKRARVRQRKAQQKPAAPAVEEDEEEQQQSGASTQKDARYAGITCPNPDCLKTDPHEEEGVLVCLSCGTLISESNIVNEVTFGETSAGAAVVQGGYVGEGQRNAKTLGGAFRVAGGGESREVSENKGRDQITRLSNALEPNLNETIRGQAFSIYRLLLNSNFVQGRQVQEVAAACLYLACRRSKDNQVLLMDFAEILQVSVYRLGRYYADVKKELCLDNFDSNGVAPVIQPEKMIYKFARRMEFQDKLMKVCEDAAKLMKRMKRDWMVTGRSPAGLCGACLILAARMNNFRRTVREVVYVVRVAGLTVTKRLEEFKRTKASELSVDDFRKHSHLLKASADPPALYERAEKEERKRQAAEEAARNGTPRIDADGFAIPSVPSPNQQSPSPETNGATLPTPEASQSQEQEADLASSQEASTPKKRGRKPKIEKPKPPPPSTPYTLTPADLLEEEVLEDEISNLLNDPTILENMTEEAHDEYRARAEAIAASEREKADLARQASSVPPSPGTPVTPAPTETVAPAAGMKRVREDEEIDEDEFADDPEVRNCVLNDRERKIKERIWVTHNEDWLRAQQAKLLKKTLDEANGVGPGGSARRRKRTRKRARMGDGTLLAGETVTSAAEATQKMLEKHTKGYSKHIDYDRLNNIYRDIMGKSSASTAASTTNATSVLGSATRASSEAPSRGASEDFADEPQSPVGARRAAALKTAAAKEAAAGLAQEKELKKQQRQHERGKGKGKGKEKVVEQQPVDEDDDEGFNPLYGDGDEEEADERTRRVMAELGVDEEDMDVYDDGLDVYDEEAQVGLDPDDDDF